MVRSGSVPNLSHGESFRSTQTLCIPAWVAPTPVEPACGDVGDFPDRRAGSPGGMAVEVGVRLKLSDY